jgi:tetratricopeptide (TPR) repeat protein
MTQPQTYTALDMEAPRTRWARRLAVVAVLVVGVLMVPRVGICDDKATKLEAKAEVEKANLHYKLGRFDQALAAYTRAYELFNAPALLFNIGQCHKNLKTYDRAIFFFEGYLRDETDPEKRALAEQLIASSRTELQRQQAAQAATAPAPNLFPTHDTHTPGGDTLPAGAIAQPGTDAPAPTPITHKWWFWTALGVATAAVAGGTIAYYATGSTTIVPPSGSVGTLDRR